MSRNRSTDPQTWLRQICSEYKLEPIAIYRDSNEHSWPIQASGSSELLEVLDKGGHLLPLPLEPAALANVLEVSIVAYLKRKLADLPGITVTVGKERAYPDLELSGASLGGSFHAVDIKVARRKNLKQTQSRITLFTGNTFFRYPSLWWPNTLRPFEDYSSHLDLVALYTLDSTSITRITDVELIVHESWRLASKQRSSTTREYIGAVDSIARLRAGEGDFSSPEEFYKYWRKYSFRIGKSVEQQLNKLLKKAK